METTPTPPEPPASEPVLNAPLLPLLVAASLPALYYFQTRLPDGGFSLAFRSIDLETGRWGGLFTTMLLHGSWPHVLTNAMGAATFGVPVARVLKGTAGIVGFLGLCIAGGVAGALGYALFHPGSADPLVGASGAVFALIGGAMRLMGGRGRVLSLRDPRVIRISIAWMAINLVVGIFGLTPGADGARVAWEAHAFGYLVGLLAIGPLHRLLGPKPPFDLDDALSDPRS